MQHIEHRTNQAAEYRVSQKSMQRREFLVLRCKSTFFASYMFSLWRSWNFIKNKRQKFKGLWMKIPFLYHQLCKKLWDCWSSFVTMYNTHILDKWNMKWTELILQLFSPFWGFGLMIDFFWTFGHNNCFHSFHNQTNDKPSTCTGIY